MDMSKLPRLSQTPGAPASSAPDPVPPGSDAAAPPPAIPEPLWCRSCHAPNRADAQFCNNCGARLAGAAARSASAPADLPAGSGAEAWISVAVGALLLFMNPMFIKFLVAHKPYRPFQDPDVNYTDSINFWSDLAITAFAVVLIVEGLVLVFARRRWLLMIAFALTLAATVGNLLYLVLTYREYGLAIMSAVAVVFGVYIAMHQWSQLKASAPPPRAAAAA
jgi:hypothetical protein